MRVHRVRPRAGGARQRLPLERIKLPPGFEIGVFADGVPVARSLALGRNNVLFVGTRGRPRLRRALSRRKGDAGRHRRLGLRIPNGVALRDGALYVAEVNRILRFDDIEAQLDARPETRSRHPTPLPGETHHGLKFHSLSGRRPAVMSRSALRATSASPIRAMGLISRIRPDGSDYEVFARACATRWDFDWDPRTRELWFTTTAATCWATICPPTS